MSRYELSLSPNYCKDWGVTEAIRELFQNAIDNKNEMFYSYEGTTFKIGNYSTKLDTSTLLLGNTSKNGKDTIGQFGEGYKIAMLILTRMNKPMVIYNCQETWTPKIIKSRRYNSDLLVVDVKKVRGLPNDLVIEISNISAGEYQNIVDSILHLQEYNCKKTKDGEILLSKKGQIFVEGLHVCHNKDLKYGYNFKSKYLELGRDRDIISSFNIMWETSRIWANLDEAVDLIEQGVPDVMYINNHISNDKVAKALYNNFVEKHGEEATPVTTQAEAAVVSKPIIVNSNTKNLISKFVKPAPYKEPLKLLQDWFAEIEPLLSDEQVERFYNIKELL